jgi:hypothetical protein
MSEADHEVGRQASAGRILTFHTDHRRGLHTTPIHGCSECLLDRVMDASEDELVDLLDAAEVGLMGTH